MSRPEADKEFSDAYLKLLNDLVGRPSMLTHAKRLSENTGLISTLSGKT